MINVLIFAPHFRIGAGRAAFAPKKLTQA